MMDKFYTFSKNIPQLYSYGNDYLIIQKIWIYIK